MDMMKPKVEEKPLHLTCLIIGQRPTIDDF